MEEESNLIRIQATRSANREHAAPIYLSSSFIFDDAEHGRALFSDEVQGNIYSRYSNPNTSELIEKMCFLEGAEDGLSFASGMAAVFASFAGLLRAGDHVLACRSIFGSTHQILTQLLPRWGISSSYVDASRTDTWEAAIQPNTKMLFFETPSNPGLELVDLEFVAQLKAKYGFIVNIDNCFATPYLQKPIQYGADLVSHSATKYIDGQGRVLGGLLLGRKDLIKEITFFIRHTGPALSAFNAWVLSKSLETLPLRMDKHCSNALTLAQVLEKHAKVARVRYPFLPSHPQYELAKRQMKLGGGIVTFEVEGNFENAKQFLDGLKMICLTSNLGDSRTIATHPASTTHAKLTEEERLQLGILPNTIRISVGLEHPNDIIEDIVSALNNLH